MAATIASAMPVLPLVASISVSPGVMVPRRSAPSTIESAGRSLTEPAGLLPSSFASSTLPLAPGMRCRRTSGVLAMNCSSVVSIAKSLRRFQPGVVHARAPAAEHRGAHLQRLGLRRHEELDRVTPPVATDPRELLPDRDRGAARGGDDDGTHA